MAKGNNTADNANRGKLTVRCSNENCGKDMELIKVKGCSGNGMYLVCPSCGNRIKYTKGIYKNYEHYIKL
jgi:DNA-directed RNA polymerase subunit RPC12/RpoP